jgi:hypothetical protein
MARVLCGRAVILVMCLGLVAACAHASSNAKQIEVQTANGQLSLSLNGQLPPNWPHDAPVPPNAHPAGSASLVGESQGVMAGVYRSKQSPEQVYEYYTTESSITTESHSAVGSGDKFVGRVTLTHPVAANVTIVPYEGGSLFVMVISGGRGPSTTPTTLPTDATGRR